MPLTTDTPITKTDNVHIKEIIPLIPPQCLIMDFPATPEIIDTVTRNRIAIQKVFEGNDDRLVVIVGPCSIHDPEAAKDYARRLKEEADKHSKDLLIIMRVYFEKPRTTVGWKGLINDPNLDNSFQINKGLRTARELLLDINGLGLAAGVEYLDTISPQFIGDLVAWAAIGARTTESQVHRELASGLSCPVGFKNGTSGSLQIAVDAVSASTHPHHFLSVTKQGLAAIVATEGNACSHVILRGGSDGPNYSADHVARATSLLQKAKLREAVMVDCSHGNSLKKHENQPIVAKDIAARIATGDRSVFGIMLESHINEGRQDASTQPLAYGVSITDACIGWETTVSTLESLAEAVRSRRQK